MTSVLNIFLTTLAILISIAFYTILERKLLSYIQTRKGPNKVSIMGILQPFSDAIKLFNKTMTLPTTSNMLFILATPVATLFLSLMMWPLLPVSHFNIIDSSFNSLIFFVISSLSVYSVLTIGWAANSKYSQLGSLRSVAQMISYEINFFMMFLMFLLLVHSYKMKEFYLPQSSIPLFSGLAPIIAIWILVCTAEVNRSPFDFAEGESELVSGFNVEYSGASFAMIFLAEYANILLLSMLTTLMFTGLIFSLISTPALIFTSLIFLWLRGTFPRFRYDLLMTFNWKIILPLTTLILYPFITFLMLSI